jgi:hypothetical protein
LSRNDLSRMLNNPFYMGIIRIKGQTFNGLHEPLISPALFKQVEAMLKNNGNQKIVKHDFLFKRLIKCKSCGYSLIAETQKGNTYYRCHTKGCETKGIRESHVSLVLNMNFKGIQLYKAENDILNGYMQDLRDTSEQKQEEFLRSAKLQVASAEKKLELLMDHFFEQGLEREIYERRKTRLLVELKEKESTQKKLERQKDIILRKTERFLELSKSLTGTFKIGNPEEKLELIKTVTSNLSVQGKKLIVTMRSPFFELGNPLDVPSGAPTRDTPRQKDYIFDTTNIIAPCARKPMNRRQLKLLFDHIVEVISELPDDSNESYGV